jgi:hypothetical protein
MRISRSIAFAALAVAALASFPTAFAQPALLDGRAFVADAGHKGKPADEKGDVLTFANGRFHSSLCDQYGYDKGEYKATRNGDAVEFEAVTVSEKYGRNVWKGTIRGNDIEGTFLFHPKPGFFNRNPAPEEHWFKGKAKG